MNENQSDPIAELSDRERLDPLMRGGQLMKDLDAAAHFLRGTPMKYIHKKSRKILTRLPFGEAPPREWFEAQGILGTYVGWFSWMHYYSGF